MPLSLSLSPSLSLSLSLSFSLSQLQKVPHYQQKVLTLAKHMQILSKRVKRLQVSVCVSE